MSDREARDDMQKQNQLMGSLNSREEIIAEQVSEIEKLRTENEQLRQMLTAAQQEHKRPKPPPSYIMSESSNKRRPKEK